MQIPMIAATCALLSVGLSSAAVAEDRLTLFGVPLGLPISESVPHCSRQVDGKTVFAMDRMCISVTRNGPFHVLNPLPGELPEWVAGIQVILAGADETVDTIRIDTNGAAAQDDALKAMVSKFGKPKTIRHTVKQNAMGAQIPALTASWEGAQYKAVLLGVTDRVDEGAIVISSPAGVASISRSAADAKAKQRAF